MLYFILVCNRKFVTKYRRDVHERRHDVAKPFECASCGMAFDEVRRSRFCVG
jgi:hypothetical protein